MRLSRPGPCHTRAIPRGAVVTPLRRLLASLVAAVVIGGGASAVGASEEDLALRYTMHFGGFHVADLQFEREIGEDGYEAGVRIRTTGLADVIVRYDGRARAEGLIGEDALSSTRYRYRYKSRNGERMVRVIYDPATATATDVVSQKRGRDDTTDVPRDLWRGVVDPLSAVMLLRDHVRERRDGGTRDLELAVFDGRRRYDLEARVVDENSGDDTIVVDATIRPVAGFDVDDMSEREIREGYRLQMHFSDDDRVLPLEVRTLNTRAIVVIRLARDCSLAPCTATAAAAGSSRG
jgi:hypothetical protein